MTGGVMTTTDQSAWKEIGRRIEAARLAMQPKMSKRAVARAANVSDIFYRQLVAGERQVAPGVVVPVNPRDENLAAVAYAVELDPRELFALAGREWDDRLAKEDEVSLAGRVDAVERRLERIEASVEEMVRRLAPGNGPRPKRGGR